jgi:CubicO group peptidase (beta-lactamase class C family)
MTELNGFRRASFICHRRAAEPFFCALVLLLASGRGLEAQDETVWARVDSVFSEMNTSWTPGCAVSVMERGSPVYTRGYGMANLEYGIPITPASVFHVASVSKQFTAFAVSLLAAEGELSWEDDIRSYVPEVPDFGETITLRHLANHTSGIRDQWSLLGMAGWRFEADVITQGDVLDITSRQTALNFPVGTEYLYSNTGFTLLAVVVERVSGQTLKEFAQKRIFGPLGMTGTHFHDDHNTIVTGRAYAYAPIGEGEYRISIPDFDVVGATSLHTTVEDMARWDRNFYTDQVGGREVVQGMLRRGILRSGDTIDYALGLSHGSYRSLPTVGHGGSDAGYRSRFLRFPEQETSLAVLCNFPSSNPGGLANRVADIVLEDVFSSTADAAAEAAPEPAASDAVPLPPGDAERLDGYYVREDYDRPQSVRARDGSLWIGSQRLNHEGDWVFRVGDGRRTVRFREDSHGTIHLNALDGKTYERYPRIEVQEVDPMEYAGRYWSDDLGTAYEVRMEDGELVFWHRKIGTRTLRPRFPDGFSAGNSITFTRDSLGEVDGFTMSSGRVWKVRFRKLDESP